MGCPACAGDCLPQQSITAIPCCARELHLTGLSFLQKGAKLFLQSKKRQYDQEIENLEKQQKQTIERLEQEHTNRLRDEAKRIKAEQEKELSKFQNVLKNKKKEVRDDDNMENKEDGHSKQLRLGLPETLSSCTEVWKCHYQSELFLLFNCLKWNTNSWQEAWGIVLI